MPDEIKNSPANGTNGALSIDPIQTSKSGERVAPSRPPRHAARKKRWYFFGLAALVLVCAIPVIGYLRQSETAKRVEGLGLAFSAIAWGLFLIRHFVQVVEEEDRIEEEDRLQQQQFDKNQTEQPNVSAAKQQTECATPPLESGNN